MLKESEDWMPATSEMKRIQGELEESVSCSS